MPAAYGRLTPRGFATLHPGLNSVAPSELNNVGDILFTWAEFYRPFGAFNGWLDSA